MKDINHQPNGQQRPGDPKRPGSPSPLGQQGLETILKFSELVHIKWALAMMSCKAFLPRFTIYHFF